MGARMSPERCRSLLASLVSTALDAGLFALATLALVGSSLVAARWSAGALGAVANFGLNRCWAFRHRGGHLGPQAVRYGVTAVLAVTLATALWWALARTTPLDLRLLHLLSLAAVWLAFTFPLLGRWVFAQTSSCPPEHWFREV
jgi:putative flippase GtrA